MAQLVDKRRLFQSNSLLGHLPAEDLDRLLAYSRIERYRQGDTIFLKDAPSDTMMAVVSGRVKIVTLSPDGKEAILNVITTGEVFGEISLIDGGPRTADAVAMANCELLVLDRRTFLPVLRRHPEICMRLLELLCDRLRRTSAQVETIRFLTVPARLARVLLHLAERQGTFRPGEIRLQLDLSQRELGDMAGISREGVNKQLSAWHRQGLVALSKGEITIHDEAALKRIAALDVVA